MISDSYTIWLISHIRVSVAACSAWVMSWALGGCYVRAYSVPFMSLKPPYDLMSGSCAARLANCSHISYISILDLGARGIRLKALVGPIMYHQYLDNITYYDCIYDMIVRTLCCHQWDAHCLNVICLIVWIDIYAWDSHGCKQKGLCVCDKMLGGADLELETVI